ncbi:MAG: sugar transferase [Bacteroidales bacterium]|jgi:lipopolysaccharide/colanic/teichoic acid biosynthesis glycosyltransferase|nr:sugar transferase [Bacteroidales bacterium]
MPENNHNTNINFKADRKNLLYKSIKQIFDFCFAFISLLALSPFLLLLALLIRISGGGPVIYTQDRIGRKGIPFSIYKFRSMAYDAERGVPLLSGDNEERITRIGRFLRKYRIDEIPNLLNVLKGDMSLVGPRPERQFFIDQIIKKAPVYNELQSVKPGVTSWGQVKFGYASSVDEMIERLDYDLYYMNHRSLWFDFKIIFYTIGTVLRGKGV